ncbi:hypothetical protein FDP41_005901 [Naegleria fowleri]|uniref:RNA-polymerase II-associated protein 3-like C-terminal domain-containing protein n=1 Tax=Naegleria fowleri TaxID=5763 RepID=A0A6A5BLY2_NAEFO|nr:uncharacterized protein FDP41_005901 [Naegleria fowleri]KAF0975148.1 hypothetical protein FDP41_005901 [Naegleria fowleri]
MARRELKKYKESKDDFEYARKLNPNHTETERELQKAIELLKKSEEGKGMKVTIQGEEEEEEEVVVPKPQKTTTEKTSPEVPQTSKPSSTKQEPMREPQTTLVEGKKPPKVEEEVIEDLITSGASTNLKDMQQKAATSQPTQNIETSKPVDNKNVQQPSKPTSQPATNSTKSATTSVPETLTIHLKPSIPQSAPKSFFEFEKYYNELKGEDLANYLKAFPPKRFITILRDSLSPEIFSGIIECLLKYFVRKPFDKDLVLQAFDIMDQISQVNRFDMIIMFLEDKEILMVKSIFNTFYEFPELEPSKVDSLKEKYIQE